jgi:C4-dicarboxylate-specific signal transduction histidine kinase
MQDKQPGALPPGLFEQETHAVVEMPGQAPSYYRFSVPVRFSGAVWGALEIQFSTAEYDANIASMYRQLLLISLLVTAVMLPVGYYFARWLTEPIITISRAAKRVAKGDLTAQVAIARRDEIGELSDSFNQMVAALQHSRERLQESNQTLERKVRERTSELDELNRTLDQRVHEEMAKRKEQETLLIHQSRLAAMGEMIGAIAHQWRQPLNALSLVMQNIRMQHAMNTLTDESMARMQDKAATLVGRMSSTIDEFRNFFKPGKHAEAFPVADAVRASLDMLDGVFRNHNITVTLACDDAITLHGVQGEFAQVVLNLLGNAKDALLASRQPQPRIELRAQRLNGRVLLTVEDNGGGIAPWAIDKIYEPYFITKEEGQGTGIGLYMSKMIVENHMKGQLRASNTEQGARFTLDFPAP